jgi:hypothetical protein
METGWAADEDIERKGQGEFVVKEDAIIIIMFYSNLKKIVHVQVSK